MSLLPKNFSLRIIFYGVIFTILSFIVTTLDTINIYGKAGAISSCPKTSDCGLKTNLVVSYIGIGILCIGLALIVIGILLVLKSKLNQHR
jgi:hypothetical protein